MSFLSPNQEEYKTNNADSRHNTPVNSSLSVDSENPTSNTSNVASSGIQPKLSGPGPSMDHATVTSSTASHQHQQQQEMLSGFAIPRPPVSTQQSSVAAEMEQGSSTGQPDSPRTLWMGDLDPWLDEAAITDLWWQVLHKKVNVKIIKPKNSKPETKTQGLSHSGYCFVEFESFDDAQQALALNGQLLPDIAMPSQQQFPNNPDNQKKYFRLNWASGATLSAPIVQTPEYSLFVGDLSASTTEAHLLAFFQKSFPTSIKTVRVMTDPVSGKSRCFGFVRFTDELERQRALVEMHGAWFGGRPLRVALATPRNAGGKLRYPNIGSPNFYSSEQGQQIFIPPNAMAMGGSPFGFYGNPQMPPLGHHQVPPQTYPNLPPMDIQTSNEDRDQNVGTNGQPNMEQIGSLNLSGVQHGQPFTDPNNTTVFVGGLSSEVTEQTLFTLFKPFGIIQQVKIPPGKNCGFIKYSSREEAEEAISAMQGFIIGGNRVRLSWGRVSMNNKKFQQQQQQVAQAALMQAATALSMGMDPASAIAAAAAAAAGGYPPPMPGGHPQTPGMPMMRGIPPMGLPPHIAMQVTGGIPSPSSSNIQNYQSSSEENETSFEKSDADSNEKPSNENYTQEHGILPHYSGVPADYNMPPHFAQHLHHEQDELASSMANMNLQGENMDPNVNSKNFMTYQGDHRFMMPPIFNGGFPMHDVQYQQYMPSHHLEHQAGFDDRSDPTVHEDTNNANKDDNEKNDNDE